MMTELGCFGILLLFILFPFILMLVGLWIYVLALIVEYTWIFILIETGIVAIDYMLHGTNWCDRVPGGAHLFSLLPLVTWFKLPKIICEQYKK